MKLEETVWRLLIIFSIRRPNSAFHCNTFECCGWIPVIFSKLKASPSIYSRVRTESGYRVKGSNSAPRPNLSFLKSDPNTASTPPGEPQVLSKAQTPFSVWLPLVSVMHSCIYGMVAPLAALLSPSLKTLHHIKVYSLTCSKSPKTSLLTLKLGCAGVVFRIWGDLNTWSHAVASTGQQSKPGLGAARFHWGLQSTFICPV